MPKRRIRPDLRIASVEPGSPASRAGLECGDEVVTIAGQPARDAIDFMYQADGHLVRLDVRRAATLRHVALLREPGESWGLAFHDGALDQVITCANKCPFCFLGGLKPGMRRSLYLKDDDYRLSFLHGNFITLSNLTEDDWTRLEEQALSPLYVSVHATEPDLRQRLIGKADARPILDDLERLGQAGIQVHTQLVIMPGVNDGTHLDRSIADLSGLYPTVQSVSVVPVGVTRFNHDPARALRPLTRDENRRLVTQVRPWQRQFRAQWGVDFAYLSDEVYLRAGLPIPPGQRYDGYAQYENGVGMTRWLLDDTRRLLRRQDLAGSLAGARASIACGTMAAPTLLELAARFTAVTGATIDVIPVRNEFWGETVWISGLLAGEDIARQAGRRDGDDALFLTPKALDASGSVFIDDWTPEQLGDATGTTVQVAASFSEIHAVLARARTTKETICAA